MDFNIYEIMILCTTFYFLASSNIMMLLYTAGIYLMLAGGYSLLNDSDIYIGFLWVIDLGVGLVFFIFMLHFSSFLNQKTTFDVGKRYFFAMPLLLLFFSGYFYFLVFPNDSPLNISAAKSWYLSISHLDYYSIFFAHEVSELNLLKESYFVFNSFEFFVINFSLFFGLIAAILFYFLIQRIFNFLNFSQIVELNSLSSVESSFFIRNQNYTLQQSTPQVVRIWTKKKSS
jgi:hypothetical protein